MTTTVYGFVNFVSFSLFLSVCLSPADLNVYGFNAEDDYCLSPDLSQSADCPVSILVSITNISDGKYPNYQIIVLYHHYL